MHSVAQFVIHSDGRCGNYERVLRAALSLQLHNRNDVHHHDAVHGCVWPQVVRQNGGADTFCTLCKCAELVVRRPCASECF